MEDFDSMDVKKSEQVSVIKYNEKDMNTRLPTLYIVVLSYVHANIHWNVYLLYYAIDSQRITKSRRSLPFRGTATHTTNDSDLKLPL